jgi:radical SAM superfamily enzyme YgiQ (UPF0313 family)
MAKVLMISANLAREPYPVYPLGLTMVAESARKKGHEVFDWDHLMHKGSCEALQNFIDKQNPDFVGISLRNIDSVNFNEQKTYVPEYRELVQVIRNHTDAPIILGGAAFTIIPEAIMDSVKADYGIIGEGEIAFTELIEAIENGNPPQQKILHSSEFISEENIPVVDRNPDLTDFYLKKGGMLNVQTKRGCPHRCIYCSYPKLEGRVYRHRPAVEVVDEIEMLIKKHHADYLAMTDSVFNDSIGKYLEIAEELVRREISIPWMCFLRPDKFTKEEVALLANSGLSSVEWGTDCATDTTLAAMKKDFTWDQVRYSNQLFADAGIANAHFIIFGGPGETEATVAEGLNNISKLENCVVFGSIGVRVFPHTSMYDLAFKEGVINREDDLIEPIFYFSEHIDRDKMHRQILESFNDRIDRIYPDGQLLEKTSAFHLLGYRGPIWDYILKKGQTRRQSHAR